MRMPQGRGQPHDGACYKGSSEYVYPPKKERGEAQHTLAKVGQEKEELAYESLCFYMCAYACASPALRVSAPGSRG